MKHFFSYLAAALCAASLFAIDAKEFQGQENSLTQKRGLPDLNLIEKASPASDEYVMFIDVYDWGPAVDKLVINLGKKVKDGKISASSFDVDVVISSSSDKADKGRGVIKGNRKVTDAYFTDKDGNKIKDSSGQYVCLELESGPDVSLCNPFLHLPVTAKFDQAYGMRIENEKLDISITKRTAIVSPVAAKFKRSSYMYTDGDEDIEMGILSWMPEKKGKKPLIIWLHGTGDSAATNPYMPVLSCMSGNLIGEDIQRHFPGGAAVLIPQCPGCWLETSSVDKFGFRIWIPAEIGKTIHKITDPIWRFMHEIFSSSEANMDDSKSAKSSYYTEALKELIDDFVKKNSDIDTNRIYIMGAGAGGYMALNMCVEYPDFFAAAVPVSEEYPDSKLTNSEISNLAQMPLWFVYSTVDETVDCEDFSAATVSRLKAEDAGNLHESVYKEITVKSARSRSKDKSRYDPHECWVPLFRDECASNKLQLFDWLSDQKLDKRDIRAKDRDNDRDEDSEPSSRKDKDKTLPQEDDGWGISDTPPVVL